jgi:hypothetical protein
MYIYIYIYICIYIQSIGLTKKASKLKSNDEEVRKALTHAEKMKKHKLVTDIFEARKS